MGGHLLTLLTHNLPKNCILHSDRFVRSLKIWPILGVSLSKLCRKHKFVVSSSCNGNHHRNRRGACVVYYGPCIHALVPRLLKLSSHQILEQVRNGRRVTSTLLGEALLAAHARALGDNGDTLIRACVTQALRFQLQALSQRPLHGARPIDALRQLRVEEAIW